MTTRDQENWSRTEVEAVVADYLHMLTLELAGQSYSKTEHRKTLLQKLRSRTDGSVERKHQNISAVLILHGWPRISGYKPLGNFQGLLADVILDRLKQDGRADEAARVAAERPAMVPLLAGTERVLVSPPSITHTANEPRAPYFSARNPSLCRDYIDREARNRSLGRAGETFVVAYERARLSQLGEKRLADKVEQVSETQGDGLGFDVLSFDQTGRERFIEVKTTSFGKETPFYISKNEVEFSKANPSEFHLYRIFEFRKTPKMFDLQGPVDRNCLLEPNSFIGRFS